MFTTARDEKAPPISTKAQAVQGTGALLWDGVPLSASDAIRGHHYSKSVCPNGPTPLERFALGPNALLTAQAWTISDTPYLPSEMWWRRVRRLSDRALARVVARISGLAEGRPSVLDVGWRAAWRRGILPGLLDEVKRRRQPLARRSLPTTPPIDVLETMQRLTGEEGRERRGEWWFHCPFHADRTPSLSVNPEKAVWKCLGCGKGGGWKALREVAA